MATQYRFFAVVADYILRVARSLNVYLRFLLFVCLFVAGVAKAGGGSLVTPDSILRNNLAFLRDQGVINISLSTWPMSGQAIQEALSHAKPYDDYTRELVNICWRVVAAAQNETYLEANVASEQRLSPGYFGEKDRSQNRLTVSHSYTNPKLAYRLRANIEGNRRGRNSRPINIDGSYVSMDILGQSVSVGAVSHYWGPGHTGSLIYGDTTHPVKGITIQRSSQEAFDSPWLSWIGPWNYQFTFGQLSDYRSVPNAKLINMRITASPWPFLELGAHRAIQWGGKGCSESMSSLKNAFTGLHENDAGSPEEPGNQIAGLDFRLSAQPLTGLPISIYAQMIGEDEAGLFPAKKAYLAGIDGSFQLYNGHVNWFFELADTRTEFGRKSSNIIYKHHIYQDGYYQDGLPLGYYAGGDAQTGTLGISYGTSHAGQYDMRLWRARVNPHNQPQNVLYPQSADIEGLNVDWQYDFSHRTRAKVSGWATEKNDSYDGGLRASVRYQF